MPGGGAPASGPPRVEVRPNHACGGLATGWNVH
jgi:hypothetical protein